MGRIHDGIVDGRAGSTAWGTPIGHPGRGLLVGGFFLLFGGILIGFACSGPQPWASGTGGIGLAFDWVFFLIPLIMGSVVLLPTLLLLAMGALTWATAYSWAEDGILLHLHKQIGPVVFRDEIPLERLARVLVQRGSSSRVNGGPELVAYALLAEIAGGGRRLIACNLREDEATAAAQALRQAAAAAGASLPQG